MSEKRKFSEDEIIAAAKDGFRSQFAQRDNPPLDEEGSLFAIREGEEVLVVDRSGRQCGDYWLVTLPVTVFPARDDSATPDDLEPFPADAHIEVWVDLASGQLVFN